MPGRRARVRRGARAHRYAHYALPLSITAAAATGKIARLDAVCLSPQIAEVAATLTWRRLITASAPTRAAMIATLAAANRER